MGEEKKSGFFLSTRKTEKTTSSFTENETTEYPFGWIKVRTRVSSGRARPGDGLRPLLVSWSSNSLRSFLRSRNQTVAVCFLFLPEEDEMHSIKFHIVEKCLSSTGKAAHGGE